MILAKVTNQLNYDCKDNQCCDYPTSAAESQDHLSLMLSSNLCQKDYNIHPVLAVINITFYSLSNLIHVNPERSFRGTNDGPSSEAMRALDRPGAIPNPESESKDESESESGFDSGFGFMCSGIGFGVGIM